MDTKDASTLSLADKETSLLGETGAKDKKASKTASPKAPETTSYLDAPVKVNKNIFKLGRIEVTSKSDPESNPSIATVSKEEMTDTHAKNIVEALSFSPGVFVTPGQTGGFKGSSSINIRGYSSAYVGFYIDGIPLRDFYQSSEEWSMFMTDDMEEVEISKGYVSPNYGTNNMGGAVNFITARPHKKFEVKLSGGWVSPTGHKEHLRIGGAYDKWYYQVTLSNYMRDYWDLPSAFKPTVNNPTHRRVNSKYENQRYSVKIGITPNDTDEYAFNVSYMHGKKQTPLDTQGNEASVWSWPVYDKITAYFFSTSKVNEMLNIKSRLYYDTFKNTLRHSGSVTDGIYKPSDSTTCTFWSCYDSTYDDYTLGGNLSFIVTPTKRDSLTIALNVKNNNHTNARLRKNGTRTEPPQHVRDITTALSLEYGHNFDNHVKFLFSASYENNTGLHVETKYRANRNDPYTIKTIKNLSENGYGLQALVGYTPNKLFDMYFSVSKKDYIPTMKAKYGSHYEDWINNPNLQTESSLGPDLGIGINPIDGLRITFGAYYSLKFNEIDTREVIIDGDKYSQQYNMPYTTQYFGVEAGLESSFYRDIFHLNFNYTFIGDPSGKYEGKPHNLFNLIAKITPTPNIDLVGTVRYQDRFKDSYFTGNRPNMTEHFYTHVAYTNVDLRAAYRPPLLPGFEIAGGIHNLTDQFYYDGTTPDNPYEGRSYYIEASYKY